jgi:hypothetical protein
LGKFLPCFCCRFCLLFSNPSSSASDVVLLQELVLMSLYSLGTALIGLGCWRWFPFPLPPPLTTLRITTWWTLLVLEDAPPLPPLLPLPEEEQLSGDSPRPLSSDEATAPEGRDRTHLRACQIVVNNFIIK